MKTYIIIPFRYLAGRKLRSLLTTLAVIFGVAVVLAVNMLLPTLSSVLAAGASGVTGQVDMTVTSAVGAPFQASLLDTVARTDGVAAAAPAFRRTVALSAEAKTPQFDLIGLDPTRAETVRFYQVTAGRFLNGDDTRATVISQQLAQAAGLRVGDAFKVPGPQGQTELSIVGVFNTQNQDQVLVPLKTAQDIFQQPGEITAIDVVIAAGADREAIKNALAAKLGPAYSVGSAAAGTAFSQDLQLALVMFNVFGILTLFMGAFLIFNTFRTVVVERRRDIGMLRAVGATRGTITRLLLVESALQGVIGTAIGLVLGYLIGLGLSSALQSLLGQFMRVRVANVIVPPEAFILAIVLGVGMTVLAGLLPALSAGRVPVLVALRQEQAEVEQRRVSSGAMIGAGLLAIGIVSIFLGNVGLAMLGSILILVGLIMLIPTLLNPIARLLEPVTRWLFAREGLLAEGNLRRNPGRASVTASALMIAIAIIVSLFAVFTSIQAAYTTRLTKSLQADILLLPPNIDIWNSDVGVGQNFEQKFAQIPGIGNWAGMSYAAAQVKGVTIQMLGFDPATYPKVSGLTFDKGDDGAYAQLANGRTAIASGIFASALGLKIGDSVPVQTPQGVQSYRIVGVGADYLGVKINTLYISKQNMAMDFGNPDDILLMANLKPGANAAATRAGVENLLQSYPQLTLYWGADWRAAQTDLLGQVFIVVYIILAALIIPSALGLINTLAINVLERTREIGVLRAIGATRSQVRRVVVAESLLLAMAGTAMGLLAGLALGYALVALIGQTVYSTAFFFPFTGLLLAIVVALVMALLASALPARQAARVKIVQALQYE